MTEGSEKEWIGTPLDIDGIAGEGIESIVVEFDEGKEVITPRENERFGSYDLYEAGHYIHALSARIVKGGGG